MATPIDINNATLEDLKGINNIGDRRAKSIIDARNTKGKLTLEDLKLIPNIPSSIWDHLVDEGIITVPSTLKNTKQTDQQIEITVEQNTQESELERKITCLRRELAEKENLIRERENAIRQKDLEMEMKNEV